MALLNASLNAVKHVHFCSCSDAHFSPLIVQWATFQKQDMAIKPLKIEAKMRIKANTRTESAKIRNRRLSKKYNGTATRPRLSVFCSDRQLYAMLVDDENKKWLFYANTLQKSIRSDPDISTADAAKAVGEELVKAATKLNITEISSYDRNGCVRGERIKAFEIAISEHGFLTR